MEGPPIRRRAVARAAEVRLDRAGAGVPRLHAAPYPPRRDRGLRRAARILGRRPGDRLGRRAHEPVPRTAGGNPGGARGPDLRRAGLAHQVLRLDGSLAPRRGRPAAAHPAGRSVRLSAPDARGLAGALRHGARRPRLPRRGARGRPFDGRSPRQARALRGVGLPGGVGGSPGHPRAEPLAQAVTRPHHPPAVRRRHVPGLSREPGLSRLEGGGHPQRPEREDGFGADLRDSRTHRPCSRSAGGHRTGR